MAMASLTRLTSRIRPLPFEVVPSLTATSPRTCIFRPYSFRSSYGRGQSHSVFQWNVYCHFFVTHASFTMTPCHQKNVSKILCSNLRGNSRRSFSSGDSKLPLLSTLQEEVLKVESYPPGFISTNKPHQRITKIHRLMEEASSLKSIHGAELVERLLYKVLSEGLLTCHYSKGLVAQQRDEEIYEQEEVTKTTKTNFESKTNTSQYDLVQNGHVEDMLTRTERRHGDKILEKVGQQPQSTSMQKDLGLNPSNHHVNDFQDTFDYYPVYPTIKMYTEAMQAWANSIPKLSFSEKRAKKKMGGQHATHRNKSSKRNSHESMATTTEAFDKMSTGAARRAHDLLKLMQNQHERYLEEEKLGLITSPSKNELDIRGTYCRPPRPDCVCFTAVILAYRNEGNPQVAEEILERMISSSDTITNVQPDAFCFRTVLQAWVEHPNPYLGLSKASQLLQKMEYLQKHVKAYQGLKPDTWMYNTYMQALANHTSPEHTWTAWEAKRILEAMNESADGIHANVVSFNLAMNAMARLESRKGALQAEKLLDQMFFMYRTLPPLSLYKPNSTSFHTVIKAWAGCAKNLASEKYNNDVRPSNRVEELLKLMAKLYEEDPVEWAELKPTTLTYNSVLCVLKNSANHDRYAVEKANNLLEFMWQMYEETGDRDVQPDKVTYDTVIHALINSNQYKLLERAQHWLEHMYESYSKSGDKSLMPEVHTVGVVLKSWSKWSRQYPDGAIRTQKLLDFVQDQYLRNRRLVFPDATCYLLTMAAWLKSKSCSSLDRVKCINDLLRNMERMYKSGISEARPKTAHYNIVLNACGLCQKHELDVDESERIVALAVQIYKQLREAASCDESTYFWMLSVVRNLVPEEQKMNRFEEIFLACQEEGLVSRHVWMLVEEDMQKEAALPFIQKMEGSTPSSYGSVPASWKRKLSKIETV